MYSNIVSLIVIAITNQQFEDQCQLLRYFLDQSKRILHKSELLDRTTSDLLLITHLNPQQIQARL